MIDIYEEQKFKIHPDDSALEQIDSALPEYMIKA
jgi:hypothetical protein